MYGGGREKKTKRETKRSKQAAAAAAAEAEADDGAAPSGNKRDKWLKKDSEVEHGSRRGAAWQPPQGEVDGSLGEQVFMRWDELLGAREGLKRRLDTIAAVHGWESRSARKCFLGGIEPGALVRSLRAEVCSLDAAAADLERADLLLQLQHRTSARCKLLGSGQAEGRPPRLQHGSKRTHFTTCPWGWLCPPQTRPPMYTSKNAYAFYHVSWSPPRAPNNSSSFTKSAVADLRAAHLDNRSISFRNGICRQICIKSAEFRAQAVWWLWLLL